MQQPKSTRSGITKEPERREHSRLRIADDLVAQGKRQGM